MHVVDPSFWQGCQNRRGTLLILLCPVWEGQEIKKARFAISSPTVYIYPADHNNPKHYQKVK